jgi:hypothetical protein
MVTDSLYFGSLIIFGICLFYTIFQREKVRNWLLAIKILYYSTFILCGFIAVSNTIFLLLHR